MLMYIIVAVFIAGLMVGRTPEYLGKKVEAKEVKLAMLALLIHPLVICAGAAIFAATLVEGVRGQPRPARVQRDPLRVHLGRGQQRVGLRGAGRQQPALEHRHRDRPAAGPVPRPDLPAGRRRVPLDQEAGPADHAARSGPTT